eukprot:TRINITY_DN3434_c0_g1_i2.p1 TRINITY_DN3434_c0_g1~~TRINITY_DN3434_c0_g1_i2.p1  ORF type:complete len:222 (+),score=43.08 TRINITY_DN3434_c0_g1_i2:112-777(+)
MSKISSDTFKEAVDAILKHSLQDKKRKFKETIELQIGLKNYDPQKDKRFAGTITLPHVPRDKYKVCIIGDAKHCGEAKDANIDALSVDDLKKLNKDKKKVKKLAQNYNQFLASSSLIRKIPKLLGPGLNKAGKFPSVLGGTEDVKRKVEGLKASVKFQLKTKKTTCMGVAIANVGMKPEEIIQNVSMAINFLASLLPKNWQNIKRLYIKSSMGPVQRIYGF